MFKNFALIFFFVSCVTSIINLSLTNSEIWIAVIGLYLCLIGVLLDLLYYFGRARKIKGINKYENYY